MSSSVLPPQPRPHSLADLDVTIAEAERDRDGYRGVLERVEAAGLNPRRARTLLWLAEDRVAQLHRSREVLLSGEQHEDPDSKEAQTS